MSFLSNVDVFFDIAVDAHSAMTEAMHQHESPNPTGTGLIRTIDPTMTAFKQACIAVVFSGMYLEAGAYFVAFAANGKAQADKVDSIKTYREKLEYFHIKDSGILAGAEELRVARRELVHEKALKIGAPFKKEPIRAQDAADRAIVVIKALRDHWFAP